MFCSPPPIIFGCQRLCRTDMFYVPSLSRNNFTWQHSTFHNSMMQMVTRDRLKIQLLPQMRRDVHWFVPLRKILLLNVASSPLRARYCLMVVNVRRSYCVPLVQSSNASPLLPNFQLNFFTHTFTYFICICKILCYFSSFHFTPWLPTKKE